MKFTNLAPIKAEGTVVSWGTEDDPFIGPSKPRDPITRDELLRLAKQAVKYGHYFEIGPDDTKVLLELLEGKSNG